MRTIHQDRVRQDDMFGGLKVSQFNAHMLHRKSDPPSSKAAAVKIVKTGTVETHEQKIKRLLAEYPDSTVKELQDYCNKELTDVQINKRIRAMIERGEVVRDETVKRLDCHPLRAA